MIKISETGNISELIAFFIANELEFEDGEMYGEDEVVKAWNAVRTEDERLVGGCVLARRDGHYICDGIATDIDVRGERIGEALLSRLLEEVRFRGATEVFLVARAPGFFAKYGFSPVPRAAAPDFFECFSCPQYGKSCFPEVMRLEL